MKQYAFSDCSSLKVVTIPRYLKPLGLYTFKNCPLTDVYCYHTTAELTDSVEANSAIPNKANIVLHVPSGLAERYSISSNWIGFKEYVEME